MVKKQIQKIVYIVGLLLATTGYSQPIMSDESKCLGKYGFTHTTYGNGNRIRQNKEIEMTPIRTFGQKSKSDDMTLSQDKEGTALT